MMMFNMNRIIKGRQRVRLVVILAAMGFVAPSALAMQGGGNMKELVGQVYSFSRSTRTVTMGGRIYQLTDGVPGGLLPYLKKGVTVRYRLEAPGSRKISAMWIDLSDNKGVAEK